MNLYRTQGGSIKLGGCLFKTMEEAQGSAYGPTYIETIMVTMSETLAREIMMWNQ